MSNEKLWGFFCGGGVNEEEYFGSVDYTLGLKERRVNCFTLVGLSACPSLFFCITKPNFCRSYLSNCKSQMLENLTLFVYVCRMVGSIFVPIRLQLSVNDDFVYFYTKSLYKFTSKIAQQL